MKIGESNLCELLDKLVVQHRDQGFDLKRTGHCRECNGGIIVEMEEEALKTVLKGAMAYVKKGESIEVNIQVFRKYLVIIKVKDIVGKEKIQIRLPCKR